MILLDPCIEVESFNGKDIMKKLEKACRTCYRSEESITEDSYKNLLKNCINRGHESILEHEKITITMICDIGVYKDLTRHRLASYSIESTRFCNYSKDKFDNQIKFIKPVFYKDWKNKDLNEVIKDKDLYKCYLWENCMQNIEQDYNAMSEVGALPDEMRMLLPHSTAAKVTMTANIREWKHILSLRCSNHTHPAIQQLLIPILLKLKEEMPEVFNDVDYNKNFPEEKYAKLVIL